MPIMFGPVEPIALNKSRKRRKKHGDVGSAAEDAEMVAGNEESSSTGHLAICYLCKKEMVSSGCLAWLIANSAENFIGRVVSTLLSDVFNESILALMITGV